MNGLIVQWGRINGISNEWEIHTFNFPISFSNKPVAIISSELQRDKSPEYKVCVLQNLTNKSVVATFNGGGNQNVCIFAIGTWFYVPIVIQFNVKSDELYCLATKLDFVLSLE